MCIYRELWWRCDCSEETARWCDASSRAVCWSVTAEWRTPCWSRWLHTPPISNLFASCETVCPNVGQPLYDCLPPIISLYTPVNLLYGNYWPHFCEWSMCQFLLNFFYSTSWCSFIIFLVLEHCWLQQYCLVIFLRSISCFLLALDKIKTVYFMLLHIDILWKIVAFGSLYKYTIPLQV